MNAVRGLMVLGFLGMMLTAAAAELPPAYDDATLHAVTFVDATEGWAVGEQGTIWHTIDGGQTWERQKSGTRACLKAVQFLTPYTGFAFGKTELPGSLGSQGVILKTENGGLNWTELSVGLLPGINVGKFFDGTNAVVAGEATAAFPTGLFATTDGGTSWKAVEGPKAYSWRSADFPNATSGLLACPTGVAMIENGRPKLLANPPFRVGTARPVGDAIVAFGSADHHGKGRTAKLSGSPGTWAASLIEPEVRGVATVGTLMVGVGRPGQIVARSVDQGTTWTTGSTPVHGSLNAVHMLNDKQGWAVGEFGTILHTVDGGQNWTVQKSGGQRCGIVVVAASADRVPFDVLAMHGAKDGILVGVVCLDETCDADRLAVAVRACGGAVTTVCHPDRLGEVLTQYQPDTVVLGAGVSREVMAHASRQSSHTIAACFAVVETTAKANVTWDLAAMTPELAGAVKDVCDLAAVLLGPSAALPAGRFFERVHFKTEVATDRDSLVAAERLPRGGTARRKLPMATFSAEYLTACEAIRTARRMIDTIVADPEKAGGPEKALTDLSKALVGLPEDQAARVAGLAAAAFAKRGEWGYAREVHTFVAESFPTFAEAAESCRWLIRFHTSSEVRRRIELGQIRPLPPAIFDTIDDAVKDDAVKTVGHTEASVKPTVRFKTGVTARKWMQMAMDLEPTLASFGPSVVRDPGTRRGMMIARETLGLNAPPVAEPGRIIPVTAAKEKPTLDAKFGEACWSGEAVDVAGASVRFAVDGSYLYVAVVATCEGPVVLEKVRQRDADLSRSDRIELTLDLTREGDTPFVFAVDCRGRLAESCWGDRGWNPTWFVKSEVTATTWSAEIAIPLAELTGQPVAGKRWGVQVERKGGTSTGQLTAPLERTEIAFPR